MAVNIPRLDFIFGFTFITVKTRLKGMKKLSSIQSNSMPECKKIL